MRKTSGEFVEERHKIPDIKRRKIKRLRDPFWGKLKEGQKSRRDGLDGVGRRGGDVIVSVSATPAAAGAVVVHLPVVVLLFVDLAFVTKAGGTEFKVDILVGLMGGAGVPCVAFVFHRRDRSNGGI